MNPETRNNLETATACDAVGSATYLRYAAQARHEGDWELARVFQDAAETDRTEHFASEANLQALVKSTPENLRRAITTEAEEATMYGEFAEQARQAGDGSAAALFREMQSHKQLRRAKLQEMLTREGVHSDPEVIRA